MMAGAEAERELFKLDALGSHPTDSPISYGPPSLSSP